MPSNPPRVDSVLETVLYFADEESTERFYGEAMGFRMVGREPGRSLFYRAGTSMLLLFRPEQTERGGKLPPHGAHGPGHTCFLVRPAEYEGWQRHLRGHGVDVVQQVDWDCGESFYFHDPYGNVLEVANADIWPK